LLAWLRLLPAPGIPAWALLAQQGAAPDPLSGGAGWVGAGLLGLLLMWLLLREIPDQRRQYRELLATKDAQITQLIKDKDEAERASRTEHSANLEKIVSTFKSEAAAERLACEKHFGTLAETTAKGHEATTAAMRTLGEQIASHAARNAQNAEHLAREARRMEMAKAEAARAGEGRA
jgi:hypothetical protein